MTPRWRCSRPPRRPSSSRPAPMRRAGQRGGRARESARRRDAPVHPAAPPALRSGPGSRGGTPGGAGDDERQPERRTDLLRRRRCLHPPPGHRRRMARARPPDPRAVRRLGRAYGRGRRAARPPVARSQPCAHPAGARRPAPAGRRRRPQERVLPGLAPDRVDEPAPRRHGEREDARGVRAIRRAVPFDVSRRPRAARHRPAPRLHHAPVGRGAHLRAGAGAAPPRARGGVDDRAPHRTERGTHRVRVRRHRLRHRRHGVGRRGAHCSVRRLRARRAPAHDRHPGRRRRRALTGAHRARPSPGRGSSPGAPTLHRCSRCPPRRASCSIGSWLDVWPAHRHRASDGCSMP